MIVVFKETSLHHIFLLYFGTNGVENELNWMNHWIFELVSVIDWAEAWNILSSSSRSIDKLKKVIGSGVKFDFMFDDKLCKQKMIFGDFFYNLSFPQLSSDWWVSDNF